jgi:hypothetical protein
MSVCLVAIGDGRDEYHDRSWASLKEMLPDVDYTVTIDDRAHELGFAGAIRAGWRLALETDATHIFHAELDFTYLRPVDLGAMQDTLENHPHLVQMALARGPVNDAEIAAGGVLEQHPDDYETVQWYGYSWREHRRYVTTNPALWPRRVIERGWPQMRHSEGHFGVSLFAEDPKLRAAFWGIGVDVDHIGTQRLGSGY